MTRIYVNQHETGWEWAVGNGSERPTEWSELSTRGGRPIDASATDRALARHARRAADVGLVDVTIRRIGHEGRSIVTHRQVVR
ncbi:MAG: hypothetical protein DWQ35_00460 [Planctomycetota bacterium]|nr:MAG: hypothetical protein DWQ35_00460 [Planctomycetota bacterium]